MKINFSTALAQYWQIFPWAGYFVLFLVLMGVLRYFNLNDPLDWTLQTTFMLGGGIMATVLFLFEIKINQLIDNIGGWLAHEDLNHPASEQIQTQQPPTHHSWLRSNVILLTLPILSFYLITSSNSAFGFGFLLGISTIYLIDIWKFSQGKMRNFLSVYFYQQPSPTYVRTLILGYALYYAAFCFTLILL